MEVVPFQQVPADGVEGVHEFFAANIALVMFHGGHDVAMSFGVLFKAQAVSTVDVSQHPFVAEACVSAAYFATGMKKKMSSHVSCVWVCHSDIF